MRYLDKRDKREVEINWNDYLGKIIDSLREFYVSQLSQKDQDEIFLDSFLPPCQVEVLDSNKEAVWLVVHDKEKKDKEFSIKRIIEKFGESEFAKKYKLTLPTTFAESSPASNSRIWIFTRNDMVVLDAGEAEDVIERLIGKISIRMNSKIRERQLASIERNTASLKNYITKSEQTDKFELTKITEKIDTALQEIKRIDEHDKKILSVEKDIIGMRRLVGESTDFQEWRALTSDVQRLKDEHVARKEFDSVIRRLDEKINLVNTRIEDLREIRFWSKRTVLDIALAVLATVSTILVGLLGAGIIHF